MIQTHQREGGREPGVSSTGASTHHPQLTTPSNLNPQFFTTSPRAVGAAVCDGEPAACRAPRPLSRPTTLGTGRPPLSIPPLRRDRDTLLNPQSLTTSPPCRRGGRVRRRTRRMSRPTTLGTGRPPQSISPLRFPMARKARSVKWLPDAAVCRSRRLGGFSRGGRGKPRPYGLEGTVVNMVLRRKACRSRRRGATARRKPPPLRPGGHRRERGATREGLPVSTTWRDGRGGRGAPSVVGRNRGETTGLGLTKQTNRQCGATAAAPADGRRGCGHRRRAHRPEEP
jgi:hypothetical protein